MTVETFTTPGDETWTAPSGVTSVEVELWGGGGRGGTPYVGAGGGGAGGSYRKKTFSVTPGANYAYHVGRGGDGPSEINPEDTFWVDVDTLAANAGGNGFFGFNSSGNPGGASGDGTAVGGAVTGFNGGPGGESGTTGGGGAGGSGGTAATGNTGSNGVTSSGGTGATAVTGGGAGGSGGNVSANGANGTAPGGGGGGGGLGGVAGSGADGQVRVTYTAAGGTFNPLDLAHQPQHQTMVAM